MHVKKLLVLLSMFVCFGCEKQDKPNPLGDILEAGVEGGRIPGVIAVAASSDREIFQGAAGTRDLSDGTPMTVDTIVRIASLTKAITSVAVMQLIESGKIGLDDPASEYLPRLADIEVLEGFNAEGEPMRRAPKSPVTIRQLLTHTSGYVYEIWNPSAATNVALGHVDSITVGGDGFTFAPLAFDPGTRWEYGVGTDVLGIIIAEVSGMPLDEYFGKRIFDPLGMPDTFFEVPQAKADRLATVHTRASDGELAPVQLSLRGSGFLSGGGGLFSTARDYSRFLQSLLNGGELDGVRILSSKSVALMTQNHIGELEVPDVIRSANPSLSNDVAFSPGETKRFGLGFLISTQEGPTGRSAGSASWAGLYNAYYWLDLEKDVCGVLIAQVLPFYDPEVVALMIDFESAIYAEIAKH